MDTGVIADSDFSNSIDLDPFGRPHVSYAENGSLMHAVRADPAGFDEEGASAGGKEEADIVLVPPYPNPCRGSSTLAFVLPHASEILLDVFGIGGFRVATLARGSYGPGEHTVQWNGGLPGGIYLCRLEAGGSTDTRKLIIP